MLEEKLQPHKSATDSIGSRRLLKWAGVALVVTGWLQVGRAGLALFDPVVLDYCEMTVGGAIEQLLAGGGLAGIYAPPAAPYGMPGVQYPPLFMLLGAGLVRLTGLEVVPAERLLAWGLYAAAGLLVGLCVWQETRHKWAALLAAGLPFCFWSLLIFLHAARVDPLALCLSLLAAYVYRRRTLQGRTGWPSLALVAGLCALAFFSKQTYLAVSAAIGCDLLLRPTRAVNQGPANRIISFLRSRIAAWTFGGLLAGWLGLGGLLFGVWSQGRFFDIFEPARAGSFILDKAPFFVGFFLLDHAPLLLLAGLGLAGLWRAKQRFWPLYSLFAALACLTIIKDGAVDYYFNELACVLSVVVAIQCWQSKVESRRSKAENLAVKLPLLPVKLPVAGLLLAQAVIAVGMLAGWSPWKDFDNGRAAYQAGLTLARAAWDEQAQGGRPALILVDSFLLASSRSHEIGDYFVYSVLLRNGRRDPTPLLRDLETGKYSLIMTEIFNRWPPVIETALASYYNQQILSGQDGRPLYYVYRPRR